MSKVENKNHMTIDKVRLFLEEVKKAEKENLLVHHQYTPVHKIHYARGVLNIPAYYSDESLPDFKRKIYKMMYSLRSRYKGLNLDMTFNVDTQEFSVQYSFLE